MKLSEWREGQEQIKKIKAELHKLGWTVRFSPESPMNHGPIHNRSAAEKLYQEWIRLENPYGISAGTTDEFHSYWAL